MKERLIEKMLRGIRKQEDGCWYCVTADLNRRNKYARVVIREDGNIHRYVVHRLAYEHFRGPIPKGLKVCHTCDVRWCCNPDHLFSGTQSANMQDMVKKQRGLVGEKNANAKLTEADVLEIYQHEVAGLNRRQIAELYGVKPECISHVLTGRTWTHLYKRRGSCDAA